MRNYFFEIIVISVSQTDTKKLILK